SDKGQILCQVGVESRRLRWKHRSQGVARGLADRHIYGHRARRCLCPRVTRVTADDRIKRVEHCDVDNRHRPAGTPGAELFSEDAVLSGSNWSMIETGGVNRDHVPTVKRIEAVLWAYKRMNVGCRVKQRTEYVV